LFLEVDFISRFTQTGGRIQPYQNRRKDTALPKQAEGHCFTEKGGRIQLYPYTWKDISLPKQAEGYSFTHIRGMILSLPKQPEGHSFTQTGERIQLYPNTRKDISLPNRRKDTTHGRDEQETGQLRGLMTTSIIENKV
jgi:hypothetical protein